MTITLVIPAHNEEEVIAVTIKSIEEELNLNYEIVVVNDHSVDNTAVIVKGLMKQYSNLRFVNNDTDRGFANALKKGFSVSNSELIIPVMADLCDDPRTIKDMYIKCLEGFDIVSGSRYTKGGTKIGGPLIQSLSSRFVGCSLKYLLGIPTSDVSNSFKCIRRSVLNAIKLESKGFEISMEITLKAYFAGFRIAEVPTTWRGRSIGKSKFYLFKVAPRYIKLYLWAIFGKKKA
jgi:glycosyltransferase involved in cell wall biosynthesis